MSFIAKDLNFCTFDSTGETFHQQYWKRCYDCWPNEEKGACLHCIAVCHDGHTVDSRVKTGNFFCDCGHEKKKCALVSSTHKHAHLKPRSHPIPTPRDPPIFSGWDKIILTPPGTYSAPHSAPHTGLHLG